MSEAIFRTASLTRVKSQHWQEEIHEALSLAGLPLVLVQQHVQQRPGLQLQDALHAAVLPEEVLAELAGERDVLGQLAEQLDDVGEVVLVPGVALALVGLEQEVTWARNYVSGSSVSNSVRRVRSVSSVSCFSSDSSDR